MRFSRLLLSSLFVTLCAAPSVAQSAASPQDRFSSSPLLNGQAPSYRLHSHSVVPFLKDGTALGEVQASPNFKVPNLMDQPAPSRSWTILTGKLSTPPPLSQRCYTLRQYQFEQVDPRSDATRFKDYSACQPSGQVHLKGALAR
jgi:hypothetical protein